jgi:hypothetical protein
MWPPGGLRGVTTHRQTYCLCGTNVDKFINYFFYNLSVLGLQNRHTSAILSGVHRNQNISQSKCIHHNQNITNLHKSTSHNRKIETSYSSLHRGPVIIRSSTASIEKCVDELMLDHHIYSSISNCLNLIKFD